MNTSAVISPSASDLNTPAGVSPIVVHRHNIHVRGSIPSFLIMHHCRECLLGYICACLRNLLAVFGVPVINVACIANPNSWVPTARRALNIDTRVLLLGMQVHETIYGDGVGRGDIIGTTGPTNLSISVVLPILANVVRTGPPVVF